jgi:hypothetical protein
MDETNPAIVVAFVVAVVTLMAHTGALFYWGGRITTKVENLDRRMAKLDGGG